MKIKQSETITIKRSQINFAPYNPRKESKKVVDELKKNFKNIGYLGGIVWNEQTSNLVSGHKRLQTMDIIYDYPKNDYDVKVEKINIDIIAEKEQNIFMNSQDAQGEFDLPKLADLLNEVNISLTGISNETLELIKFEVPSFDKTEILPTVTLKDKGLSEEELQEARHAKREERNQMANDSDMKKVEKNYLIVTFANMEDKSYICECLGIDPYINNTTAEIAFNNLF